MTYREGPEQVDAPQVMVDTQLGTTVANEPSAQVHTVSAEYEAAVRELIGAAAYLESDIDKGA